MRVQGFRVQGSIGFMGLGFGDVGLGLRVRAARVDVGEGLGSGIQGVGFGVWDVGFGFEGLGMIRGLVESMLPLQVCRGTVKIMVPFWVPIIIRGLIRGLI